MRNIAPQLVTYAETSFKLAGTVTTGTISWNIGDIVVVIHGSDGANTLGTPTTTGSGLSFNVIQNDNAVVGTCSAKLSVATATANSSGTLSATNSFGNSGLSVWVWRKSDGIGSSALSTTTAMTVPLTPLDTHSAICWGTFDFHGEAVGSLTPQPTTIRQASTVSTDYEYYTAEIQDQPTANTLNLGVFGGGNVGPFTNIAIEILGTYSVPPSVPVKIAPSLGALNSNQSSSQLVRTSTGNLYAVVVSGGKVQIYKSTNQGVTWTLQDYNNSPPGLSTISAAIDGTDTVHIAYAYTDNLTLKYLKYSTTTDTFGSPRNIVVQTGTSPSFGSVAIAVDSNNNPHVAWTFGETGGPSSVFRYGNLISSSWTNVNFDTNLLNANKGFWLDIQIDQNNVPWISYSRTGTISTFIGGNKNNASLFSLGTTINPNVSTTSLVIDFVGNIWGVYQGTNNGQIQLIKHNQKDPINTWQTAISSGFYGKSPSLALVGTDIYVFYERNLGGLAYDRYDPINGNWLGEQVIQPATASFRPHNPFVKWSNYFDNGLTGANNQSSNTIEYLFDDGATVYYAKLDTVQISTGLASFSFSTPAGGTTTSTSSTSSSTSTSISTSSTSSSTSISTSSTSGSTSQSTSTSSTSSSTSQSTSTSVSSTSSSTSLSTSSTSSSTSVSTSTSSTSSSTSQSTSTSISSTSSSTSVSTSSTSSSTSASTSISSTSSSISTSTSISTSSTSSSTSLSTSSTSSSISTSSTSSSTSLSTSSTSSSTSHSTSTSASTSFSTSSTSSSTSISTSSTSSSISTSSTSSSTSISSTSSSTSLSTSSTSSSVSTSTSISSTSSSTSTTVSGTTTSTSISTSSTSSSTSTSFSTSSTSSSISTSSTSSSTSLSTSSTSSSTSISTSSTSSSISTSTSHSTSSTSSSTSTSFSTSSTSSSTSHSTSSTSSSTSFSTSSTSSSTSHSTSTSSTSTSFSTSTTTVPATTTSTSSTSSSTSSTTTLIDVNTHPRVTIRPDFRHGRINSEIMRTRIKLRLR